LPLLIRTILQETDVPRLRLSSIEPENLSVETLELWRNPRLCPHLHLPLQSGCDATLKRMGRGYRVEDYVNLVETARRIIPDLAVTTDIMVGFPGESEEEFAESLRVVRALEFAKIHVFRFSPRRGTAAMRLPHHIPEAVKKERSAIMQRLGEVSAQRFRQRFLGTIRDVLWEDGEPDHSYASGLTGNYLRIYAASAVRNTITPMYLARLMRDGIWGEPVAPAAPELGKEGIAHAH
jgi:threonylcarbamoyladenosine tRNA methylthiotransferase MtaB